MGVLTGAFDFPHLGFYYSAKAIPWAFAMPRAAKIDPHHLEEVDVS